MCIVCLLWNKEKLTKAEALRALWEMVNEVPEDEISHLQQTYAEIEDSDE